MWACLHGTIERSVWNQERPEATHEKLIIMFLNAVFQDKNAIVSQEENASPMLSVMWQINKLVYAILVLDEQPSQAALEVTIRPITSSWINTN